MRDVVVEMGLMSADEVDAILTTDNFLTPRYTGKVYSADERGLPERSAR